MAKKKKTYSAASWEANFQRLKKDTGLAGWQIYLISGAMFVVAVASMLWLTLR